MFNRASDAYMTTLPTHDPSKAMSRENWDELWGSSEAMTDAAALFARQLLEVYPEANVVFVVREFDKWFKSVDEGVLQVPSGKILYLEPMLGSVAGEAGRKMILGFFEARDLEEARRNARRVWERHNQMIRDIVPPERLLEYRLADGWEPLCKFLGKPVPEGVEFPRVNDAAAYKAKVMKTALNNLGNVLKMVLPWVVALLAIGTATWWSRRH